MSRIGLSFRPEPPHNKKMDIERTMQFILEQQAQMAEQQAQFAERQAQTELLLSKVVTTVDHLAGTVEKLADRVTRLDEVMETLAEAQIQTQGRIDKLVSAMGEFIARHPNTPN